ncbi:hypothetical protein Dimus_002719 [Dionaea muscipula]
MQGNNRIKEPVKYCKPGSIDHYLRLKKRKHVNDDLLDIHVPHIDVQHQEPEIAKDDEQNLNLEMEDNVNLLPDDCEDLVLEEEDLNLEEDRHEESLPSTETGKETNPEAAAETKKCRGRTMMKEIHSRKFQHHVAIMLNEYNQPIGPDKKTMNQFSSFLGTLARIPSLCRIDCTDWRLLKTKEKMWSYAQAEMEQLQAQQGENCSTSDPFSVVMPKEHTGRVRLVGKGVTKSDLKASSSSTSTVIDDITVKVPVDLVKSITASVKTELTQEILSTVLINLQRVIPNLDSDSILAGLAAGIQSLGDVVSGHGTRNASSSFPTHTPSFNQDAYD